MDKTTGIVIVGAIGLMLLSLTLAERQLWVTEWLPPEVVKVIERLGSAAKSEIGTQLRVIPPGKLQPGGPGNRSPGTEQTRGVPLGNPEK